jgi:multisubunit Na+/H+ antiporter MnhC subunit
MNAPEAIAERPAPRVVDEQSPTMAQMWLPVYTLWKREIVRFLRRLGFNRISVGIQDFDPAVQRAVNRVQSEAETRAVVERMPGPRAFLRALPGFLDLLTLSVLSGLWALYLKLLDNTTFVQTPLPLVLVMTAIMGFMCILMGLLAELLTRTYHESQDKAVYLVKETRNVEPALVSGGPVHAIVE